MLWARKPGELLQEGAWDTPTKGLRGTKAGGCFGLGETEAASPRASLVRGCQKSIRCARLSFSKTNTAPTGGLQTIHHGLLAGVADTRVISAGIIRGHQSAVDGFWFLMVLVFDGFSF